MSRYYFHVHDGLEIIDKVGMVLTGIAAVRHEAIVKSAEMLKDYGLTFWSGEKWQMYVVDEANVTVLRLNFSAEFREDDARAMLIDAGPPD